jgi:hypothetical protein
MNILASRNQARQALSDPYDVLGIYERAFAKAVLDGAAELTSAEAKWLDSLWCRVRDSIDEKEEA